MSDRPFISDAAIAEVKAIEDANRRQYLGIKEMLVTCPDCKALIRLESKSEIPEDLEVKFVKHNC